MIHTNLDAWKESVELSISIYELSNSFPKEETFGLTSQIRRAAVSVPSNIAEGCGRESDKELLRFLRISRGSLAELETQIIIAKQLNYVQDLSINQTKISEVGRLISGLIKYLKNKGDSIKN